MLADIQEIFRQQNINSISTTDLIKHLVADCEKPWAAYNRGVQVRPKQIAKMLKEYKIHSKPIRTGIDVAKGFEKSQFTEAFSRYIPTTPNSPVTELQPASILDLSDISSGYKDITVTAEKTCKPASILDCNRVTAEIPPTDNVDVFGDDSGPQIPYPF